MTECLNCHPTLQDSTTPKIKQEQAVPAMMLKLCGQESDSFIQVVPASTVGEPFVALSYVWGPGPAPWKTDKGNLHRRSHGFNINELPKTLRDACAVMRELKLRHSWVDAICILQDDDLDWAHEATNMHRIYAHAYVTIAACESTSSHDGFFNKASYDQISDMDYFVTISNRVANGTLSTLHMWDYHRDGQWD